MTGDTGAPVQSKGAAKKAEKKAAKAEKKKEKATSGDGPGGETAAVEVEADVSAGRYGDYGILRSERKMADRVLHKLQQVLGMAEGTTVWVRGRLHTSRAKGKQCFFVLRQSDLTMQCLLSVSDNISKLMVKFGAGITKESVIDVEGVVKSVPTPIDGCAIKDREIQVTRVFVVSAAAARLPLQLEDASRPELKKDELDDGLQIRVNQDTRLGQPRIGPAHACQSGHFPAGMNHFIDYIRAPCRVLTSCL